MQLRRMPGTPVDLLTSLPAVVNVPINDSNQGGVNARGDVSSVNLRGLGSGNTLVLLNGRARGGARHFLDGRGRAADVGEREYAADARPGSRGHPA